MKDVAAAAGVSLGTVSNVINRPEIVAEHTRMRVQRSIKDLGFVPNASAQTLRAGRTRVLGLVVPDIGNPFFTEVAKGVDDAAFDAGYVVILCNTNADAAKEERYLDVLSAQRVQGILITPAREDRAGLEQRGIALTLLDRAATSIEACSVAVDDAAGGALAFEHLWGLGHRRILFLGGPADVPQVAERRRGIVDAHARVAATADTTLSVLVAERMDAIAGEQTMAEHLAVGPADFTGLICANDLLALGAIRALRAAGLNIPKDVSVIGYDDIDFAASAAVPLTSIRQPKYQLGHAAAELLISECEDPEGHVHQRVMFQPQLVVRESTKAPRKPKR